MAETHYYGLYAGVVTKNDDPEGLGRVRFTIPGLIEPQSGWALPLFMGAGSKDRGAFWPPDEGSEVGILFREGDIDYPYYLGGNYGKPGGVPDTPSASREAGANAHKVKSLETATWQIVMDDRPGTDSKLTVKNKLTGDCIEFDGSTAGITIEGKAAVVVKALGVVNIQGSQVVINGRLVRPGADPI